MKRVLILVLVALALIPMGGCMDPDPSEISVIVRRNGQPHQAGVQVFRGDRQVQEAFTQGQGANVYIKQIAPGEYTLRFVDHEYNPYPAVRRVRVRGGDSAVVEVELEDTSQNPPDA